MAILLIAEHDNQTLSDQTAKALSAAANLGADIDILVAGKDASSAAEAATKLEGVRKVLLAESDALAEHLAEPLADTILGLADGYDALVAPATTTGKNVMPRVAALLDVMQISDIIEVVDEKTFKRPIYAGNAVQTVESTDAQRIVTVRTSSFSAAGEGRSASVEKVDAATDPAVFFFVENRIEHSDHPELTSAKIIISGGRALGSAEKFEEVLLPVADKLGAAVGASRAAVDAGYAPMTGRSARPAKSLPPISTLPAAFRVPSSTWQV